MMLIFADFMKCDEESRLILTCLGTHRDLETSNIALRNGLKLVFYNDDTGDDGNPDNLVVEGVVEYDSDKNRWVAKINWHDIKNISKLSFEEKQAFGIEEN